MIPRKAGRSRRTPCAVRALPGLTWATWYSRGVWCLRRLSFGAG